MESCDETYFKELSDALVKFGVSVSELAMAFGSMIGTITSCSLESIMNSDARIQAMRTGVVSSRVIKLTYHKKKRVRNKNLNRIRKELRLYEKRQ